MSVRSQAKPVACLAEMVAQCSDNPDPALGAFKGHTWMQDRPADRKENT